ncbi:MAG: tetratricopeptide repeat protein [Phycisphaeraceae bacterium]
MSESTATAPAMSAIPDSTERAAALEAQRRWRWRVCVVILIVAGGLAYLTSLDAAFVFDDQLHIVEQPAQLRESLTPQHWLDIQSRPLVQLSLAANHALSEALTGDGLDPRPYHAFNVLVHLLAGLILFGLARRTIRRSATRALWRRRADGLALAIALLWLVHPLNTQAVTYTIQRAEVMAALFYLLALYALLRSDTARRGVGALWLLVAMGACVLGAMSKLTIVSAPVVMLLYDRAVLAGSFKAALRRRWLFYVPVAAAAMAVIAWTLSQMAGGAPRTAGFGVPMHSAVEYALNQPRVMLHYLHLAVWPVGLTLDYGWRATDEIAVLLPGWLAIGALLMVTVWALRYRPVLGTMGAAFFLVLAPTSSVVPLADLAMEHRMYLPLAAVAALVVAGVWRVLERATQRLAPRTGVALATAATVALGVGTAVRNLDYASSLSIWRDTVAKAPHNARAQRNLGAALFRSGDLDGAHAAYLQAIVQERQRNETAPESEIGLARVLRQQGRLDEATALYERIVARRPEDRAVYAEALHGLGVAYGMGGDLERARAALQRAVVADPSRAAAHADLGKALLEMDNREAAIAALRRAVELDGGHADWHNTLGMLLAMEGEVRAALPHFERAVALEPGHADARGNLRQARRMLRR